MVCVERRVPYWLLQAMITSAMHAQQSIAAAEHSESNYNAYTLLLYSTLVHTTHRLHYHIRTPDLWLHCTWQHEQALTLLTLKVCICIYHDVQLTLVMVIYIELICYYCAL
jgi:hypothetical protein